MSIRTRVCPPGAKTAIFVEGGDDERMVQRLLGSAPVFYQCFDGRAPKNLKDRAAAASKDPGWPQIRNVAVLLDAEDDLDGSRILIRSVFETLGLPVPGTLGVVERFSPNKVGAYLLPDNQMPGAAETLLLRGANPARLACIDAFFECTPNPGTTTAQRDKARAQALAAATLPGGRPDMLWSGANADHPAFATLRAFLAELAAAEASGDREP